MHLHNDIENFCIRSRCNHVMFFVGWISAVNVSYEFTSPKRVRWHLTQCSATLNLVQWPHCLVTASHPRALVGQVILHDNEFSRHWSWPWLWPTGVISSAVARRLGFPELTAEFIVAGVQYEYKCAGNAQACGPTWDTEGFCEFEKKFVSFFTSFSGFTAFWTLGLARKGMIWQSRRELWRREDRKVWRSSPRCKLRWCVLTGTRCILQVKLTFFHPSICNRSASSKDGTPKDVAWPPNVSCGIPTGSAGQRGKATDGCTGRQIGSGRWSPPSVVTRSSYPLDIKKTWLLYLHCTGETNLNRLLKNKDKLRFCKLNFPLMN